VLQATKDDLPEVTRIVRAAFHNDFQEDGASILTKFRRWSVSLTERSAIAAGEVFLEKVNGIDVVLHVGQRGSLTSIMRRLKAHLPLIGGVVAFLAVPWAAVAVPVIVLTGEREKASWLGVLASVGALVVLALLLREPTPSHHPPGPGLLSSLYRKGVGGPYWVLTTLAATPQPRGAHVLISLVPQVKQLIIPKGARVIAVPRTKSLYKIYGRYGLEQLGHSKWVLKGFNH
jgi:hypothetical protein